MPKSFVENNSIYTNSEWFLAKITFVCDKEEVDCDNFPCSWQQMVYCDNLKTLTTDALDLIYGDCEEGYNIAYPVSEQRPNVDDIVLMRFRGTVDQDVNIFEFILVPNSNNINTLSLTAIQCSGGEFVATYSEGCISQ